MGAHMSMLALAGEFLPRWVRAIGLRAEDLGSLIYSFGPDAAADTNDIDEEKVEIVLSQVVCDRPRAINALLSTGNDVDAAISFLRTFSEDIETSQDDIVNSTNDLDLNVSSSEQTNQNNENDEILTESSVPPVFQKKGAGHDDFFRPTDTRSYAPSSIQVGETSQFDPEPGSSTVSSQDGFTELLLACRCGSLMSVKRFLERGGEDINNERETGYGTSATYQRMRGDMSFWNATPLMVACHAGHLQIVKELLSCEHANVNHKNEEDFTALHVSVQQGHFAIVKMLIHEFNAQVDATGQWQKTMLHYAAESGSIEMVKMLIKDFDLQVDAKDSGGKTMLHYAAEHGHLEMVKMLIKDFNLQVDAKDDEHRTMLHYAVLGGNLEMVKLLIKDFNMQVDAKDEDQRTMLHFAARSGHLEITKYLVKTYPSVFQEKIQAKNFYDESAQDLAEQRDHTDVVEFLKSVTETS